MVAADTVSEACQMERKKRDSRLNPCAVYRLFNQAGELLYIGMASNALARIGAHRATAWFRSVIRIELQWFPNRNAAETAEKTAIAEETPQHNKQHNGGCKPPGRPKLVELPYPSPDRELLQALGPVWERLYRDDD
jgi:hypothetical protein